MYNWSDSLYPTTSYLCFAYEDRIGPPETFLASRLLPMCDNMGCLAGILGFARKLTADKLQDHIQGPLGIFA